MNIEYLISAPTRINYCDSCSRNLDLCFEEFSESISGVRIKVDALPMLVCQYCKMKFLPDRSRSLLIDAHHRANDQGSLSVQITRKKLKKDFGYTTVPFQYDPDDYYYIPGLFRSFDEGFLTPVFFNIEALIKYDVHPSYNVVYASRTYGTIKADQYDIAFGINKNRRVVMWLGDIAGLPEKEQYYLLSENVPSDNSIGSEFYDGQIECKFTDQTPEDELFMQRSRLLEACFAKFGVKLAHLDKEVLDAVELLSRPIVDTSTERRRVADLLNKIYIESFDSKELLKLLSARGMDGTKLGSLKRLQMLLEDVVPKANISNIMTPLYVLYDFRVAYAHLSSEDHQAGTLVSVTQRLGLYDDADLHTLYDTMIKKLCEVFVELADALQ